MRALFRAGLASMLGLILVGCLPSAETQTDEQKDPFYLTGKTRVNDRDYRGAIESFEKALENNPRNAAAHFELGLLYEQQENDCAAALYHYERAVKLRPNDHPAENARQRIEGCKRELAKSVAQLPSMEKMQAELDRLKAENIQMRQLVNSWSNYAQTVVRAANDVMSRAPATGQLAANTGTPTGVVADAVDPVVTRTETIVPRSPTSSGRSVPTPVASNRTHKVAPGETMGLIAKRYGVNLRALQAANPSVDARRMRAGQTLVLPPP